MLAHGAFDAELPLEQQLIGWLKTGKNCQERRDHLRTWLESIGAGHSREGLFFSTAAVAAFMAHLASIGGGSSVIDPVCGTGLLLAEAAEALDADVIHGVELNIHIAGIAHMISPENAEVFQGDSLHGTFPLAATYDLIIAEPPFGIRLEEDFASPFGDVSISDLGRALVCKWVQRLSPDGRAVFLLPASCLSTVGKRMWRSLATNGFHLRALIHVPSGNLKSTMAESYIVVVDRNVREKIFTAQFGKDEALQKQILANYKNHCRGGKQAQGRLVDLESFGGFKAMEAGERLVEHAKRAGLTAVRIEDLVESFEVIRSANELVEDGDNDVYIPVHGRCQAALSIDEIRSRNNPVIRLAIRSDVADARFMAESLNDEVGRLFLESVSRSSNFMMSLDSNVFRDATFYLPSREVQGKVVKARSRILALRAELDEIDSSLRSQPTHVEKLAQRVNKVNHEDTLENWLESLPFPLATILWRYRAFNGVSKERNEILLHFFEALAEFWATIYLSAAKSDSAFWADHAEGLDAVIKKANFSFEMATFGLWKCVIEFLRRKFEELMKTDRDRCSQMFATSSRDVLEMLFDKRLVTLLQTANSIRNGKAHGGVLGQSGIREAHSQLVDLVQTCRSIMGSVWERYELVQPCECRFVGGLFNYKVRIITGTRTPFVMEDRKTVGGMEDRDLHLLDPEGDRALRLLPFVRVMPSPKTEANACYFYNKRVAPNQHFVSYHFEADSHIEDSFEDTRIALDSLKPISQQVTEL
jgi:tRNA1(Val) A37 N6-methylase TrmN6